MITSETEVFATIDWYSYTSDNPTYHPKSTMNCIELEYGLYGYTNGVKFLDGRLELVNPDQPAMKTHVQYSGSALMCGSESYQVSPWEIIGLTSPNMQVTRIDVALDIRQGSLDIKALAKMTDMGHYLSKATSSMYISTLQAPGETLYIGAPSSKVRLRIYDKAAEQNLAEDWTRLELQVKGKRADNLRNSMVASDDGAALIAPTIRGFADFPESREYQQVMGSKSIGLSTPQPSETDTQAWLLTTIISALSTEIAMDETGNFAKKWMTALKLGIVAAKKKISQA